MLSRLRELLRPQVSVHLDVIEVARGSTVILRYTDDLPAPVLAQLQNDVAAWCGARGVHAFVLGPAMTLQTLSGRVDSNQQGEGGKYEP